jgi:hypothetical protein
MASLSYYRSRKIYKDLNQGKRDQGRYALLHTYIHTFSTYILHESR